VPFSIQPEDYPLALSSSRISLRAQRSIEMITAQEKLAFADVVRFKLSTRLLLADRVLEDLERAVGHHGSSLAREAMAVLQAWDRNTDNNSRGAVLFVAWAEHAGFGPDEAHGPLFRVDWQPDRPLDTPHGLAELEHAATALDVAAQRVLATHGRLDVAYGEVYRLRWDGGIDLSANGATGSLGSFRVTNFLPTDDDRYRAFAGDSLVFIVEFSDPVRAHATVSYGNASHSGSTHNGDQLELYSSKELRPVWRTREDIEANLAKRERLVYPL
jgi:acyl-homoserine-lactone acylase